VVRLTHLSGSRAGRVETLSKPVLRVGRGAQCDLRFDAAHDLTVSTYHAEIRFDGTTYVLVDTDSTNGTLLNGRSVTQEPLRSGDVIVFGGAEGPQVRFEAIEDPTALAATLAAGSDPGIAAPRGLPRAGGKLDAEMARLAQHAAAQARVQRQGAGSRASGQTMLVIMDAIQQAVARHRSGWMRWAAVGGAAALTVIAVLVAVVIYQQRQLAQKVGTKQTLDSEISDLQTRIQRETDEARLGNLVAQLETLSGQAASITEDLTGSDRGRKALEKAGIDPAGDFVEREIRRILQAFDAATYKIPRPFRDRVEHYLAEWRKSPSGLRLLWERRQRHWPMIARAFAEERVPHELAYVAWVESNLDPAACSMVGARGMWQFMPATGRRFNLRIDRDFDRCRPRAGETRCDCGAGVDDRVDPYKASRAAAQYLGALLSEFGTDSFMLAIASYNKGEEGMRKVLRDQKLRTRAERDFWHLYYLKLLPNETLEYVPKIIAVAIVGNNPREFGLE
jgi:hypothetical protein